MEKGFFCCTKAQRPHPSIAVRADYSELTKFKEWDDALKAITHEHDMTGHVHSTSVVDKCTVMFGWTIGQVQPDVIPVPRR